MLNGKKFIHILAVMDSAPVVGLGHIKRTRNLLSQLRFKNKRVLVSYLVENNFEMSFSDVSGTFFFTDFNAKQKVVEELQHIHQFHKIDVVLMDSYKISGSTVDALVQLFPETVFFMVDDTNRLRKYNCDFILNYNPMASTLNYETRAYTQSYLGLTYFPAPPQLKVLRSKKKMTSSPKDVLVTMGGSDPGLVTDRICRVVQNDFENYHFHIVVGPSFSNADKLLKTYRHQKNFTFYQHLRDLTPLMLKTDIAISAAGVSGYELAYIGKPAIIIPLSQTQILNAQFFQKQFSYLVIDYPLLKNQKIFAQWLKSNFKNIVQNRRLREGMRLATAQSFRAFSSDMPRELQKRLQGKILRHHYPVHLLKFDEIIHQYDQFLQEKEEYKKVRWGSLKGMINRFKLVKKFLSTVSYQKFLDIGCGTGRLFKIIAEEDKSYFGCDLNLNMLLYAQRKLKSSIKLFNASGNQLPLKSKSIDVVSLLGVLQNCGIEPKILIQEIHRILAPKGYLFIMTKNLGWQKFFSGGSKPDREDNWFFDYEVAEILQETGFKIITKSGFLNRSGRIVDIDKSHEIFYWVQKK